MKIIKEDCIGCGLCSANCPETFEMDEENKAKIIDDKVTECAKTAADDCPTDAIKI
tara:strand:- start:254 stop:421 length:168 start_codon:yes stop_codon:yes gene_type:complete